MSKKFVTADDAEHARRLRDEKYRRLGQEPPPDIVEDVRPLAERLAEQRQLKEKAEEEKARLANQIHKLDEDEVEFLNEMCNTQIAEALKWEEEQKELARYRKERSQIKIAERDAGIEDQALSQNTLLLAALGNTDKILPPPEPPQTAKRRKVDTQQKILFKGVHLRDQQKHKRLQKSPQPRANILLPNCNYDTQMASPMSEGLTLISERSPRPESPGESESSLTSEPEIDPAISTADPSCIEEVAEEIKSDAAGDQCNQPLQGHEDPTKDLSENENAATSSFASEAIIAPPVERDRDLPKSGSLPTKERSRSRSPEEHPQLHFPTHESQRNENDLALRQANPRNRGPVNNCRVYIGNLCYKCEWQDLKDFGRQAGDVINADIVKNSDGSSKGCGVVEFSNPTDATRAIEMLDGKNFMGRRAFVREDRGEIRPSNGPRSDGILRAPAGPPNPCRVFVSNLPYSIRSRELEEIFAHVGEIVHGDILVHGESGRSKGSGTILFANAEAAQHAIAKFHKFLLNGREIEVREDRGSAAHDENRDLPETGNTAQNRDRKPRTAYQRNDNNTRWQGNRLGKQRTAASSQLYNDPRRERRPYSFPDNHYNDRHNDRHSRGGRIDYGHRAGDTYRKYSARTSGGDLGGSGSAYRDSHEMNFRGGNMYGDGRSSWDTSYGVGGAQQYPSQNVAYHGNLSMPNHEGTMMAGGYNQNYANLSASGHNHYSLGKSIAAIGPLGGYQDGAAGQSNSHYEGGSVAGYNSTGYNLPLQYPSANMIPPIHFPGLVGSASHVDARTANYGMGLANQHGTASSNYHNVQGIHSAATGANLNVINMLQGLASNVIGGAASVQAPVASSGYAYPGNSSIATKANAGDAAANLGKVSGYNTYGLNYSGYHYPAQ